MIFLPLTDVAQQAAQRCIVGAPEGSLILRVVNVAW